MEKLNLHNSSFAGGMSLTPNRIQYWDLLIKYATRDITTITTGQKELTSKTRFYFFSLRIRLLINRTNILLYGLISRSMFWMQFVATQFTELVLFKLTLSSSIGCKRARIIRKRTALNTTKSQYPKATPRTTHDKQIALHPTNNVTNRIEYLVRTKRSCRSPYRMNPV